MPLPWRKNELFVPPLSGRELNVLLWIDFDIVKPWRFAIAPQKVSYMTPGILEAAWSYRGGLPVLESIYHSPARSLAGTDVLVASPEIAYKTPEILNACV